MIFQCQTPAITTLYTPSACQVLVNSSLPPPAELYAVFQEATIAHSPSLLYRRLFLHIQRQHRIQFCNLPASYFCKKNGLRLQLSIERSPHFRYPLDCTPIYFINFLIFFIHIIYNFYSCKSYISYRSYICYASYNSYVISLHFTYYIFNIF